MIITSSKIRDTWRMWILLLHFYFISFIFGSCFYCQPRTGEGVCWGAGEVQIHSSPGKKSVLPSKPWFHAAFVGKQSLCVVAEVGKCLPFGLQLPEYLNLSIIYAGWRVLGSAGQRPKVSSLPQFHIFSSRGYSYRQKYLKEYTNMNSVGIPNTEVLMPPGVFCWCPVIYFIHLFDGNTTQITI